MIELLEVLIPNTAAIPVIRFLGRELVRFLDDRTSLPRNSTLVLLPLSFRYPDCEYERITWKSRILKSDEIEPSLGNKLFVNMEAFMDAYRTLSPDVRAFTQCCGIQRLGGSVRHVLATHHRVPEQRWSVCGRETTSSVADRANKNITCDRAGKVFASRARSFGSIDGAQSRMGGRGIRVYRSYFNRCGY